MLDGERFSGAAHAAHDFIGDQKNAVASADFGNSRGVAVGRSGGAESRADYWFENEGGDVRIRRGGLQQGFEVVRAGEIALRKFQIEWAVVAEARRDVSPFGEERLIRGSAANIAAYRHRAKRASVIALAARDNTESASLAVLEPILARKFDRRFGRFGATRREINAPSVVKIGRSQREQALGKSFGGRGMKLRRVRKCDLRGLRPAIARPISATP